MQRSPLAELTTRRGAAWRTDGGWEVPAHYGDPAGECAAAHDELALRDASHLTRLSFSGRDHLDFLHRMTTNHFRGLQSGHGLEAVLPDHRGRIVDLGTFYRAGGTVLAVLSPGGGTRIMAWLDRFIFTEQIAVRDLTEETAMLEVLGPRAAGWAAQVLGKDPGTLPAHGLATEPSAGGIWLARLDVGHPGVRAIGPRPAIQELWEQLEQHGARPLGEEAWEVLRVEQGRPVAGRELTDEHNPWEAGLGHTVHPGKGCYIGQEVIARLDAYGKVKQRLAGLRWPLGRLPDLGTAVRVEEQEAGRVTSAVASAHLHSSLALAYLQRGFWEPGTRVEFSAAGGRQSAQVTSVPFAAAP